MKKKSQIRKYTVQKVAQLTKQQTIPEMLKMYAEHVEQKKKKLQSKKQQMIGQLNQIRKQSQKITYQMVDGVKDRLQKNQKIVMTASSRPSSDDIKQLSDLFSYMENQTGLINKNSRSTEQLFNLICEIDKKTSHDEADYTQLDAAFQKLQTECARQEIIRDKLLAERDANRDFYSTIKQTIEQYRVKYDIVEAQIAQRQRQLDHLVSYFKIRQEQDKQKIQKQLSMANEMQTETLKAQQIANINSNRNTDLQMRENEYLTRKESQK